MFNNLYIIIFIMNFLKTMAYLFLLALLISNSIAAQTQKGKVQANVPVSNIGDTIKGISYKVDQGRSSHYIRVG